LFCSPSGNIIPAIATTNAIAAGLQILQVFQILRAQLEAAKKMPDHDGDSKSLHLDQYCSYINVVRNATRSGLLLTASKLAPPNPNCFVCKNAILTVKLSVDKWNLQEFLEKIVKKKLGFDAPMLILEGGDCIWEEGEDADTAAFEKNLTKPLPQLPRGGIQHGTMMTIEDFSQDLTVEVAIAHVNEWPKKEDDEEEQVEDEFRFEVEGVQQKPVAATNEDNTSPKTVINGSAINEGDKKPSAETEDDDDIVEVLPTANGNSTGAARMTPAKEDDDDDDDDVVEVLPMNGDSKRPAAEENGDAPPAKKARPSNDEPEVIEID
jgi:ubiquitin-like 1-activating enzyme E1 B